jgi:hypothetical protein
LHEAHRLAVKRGTGQSSADYPARRAQLHCPGFHHGSARRAHALPRQTQVNSSASSSPSHRRLSTRRESPCS